MSTKHTVKHHAARVAVVKAKAKPSKAAKVGDIVLVYTDSSSGSHITAPAIVTQSNEDTGGITASVVTQSGLVSKTFSYAEGEEVGTWEFKKD